MATILTNITMGTGLALAIDKNDPNPGGQLLLEKENSADPDQQWTWVFDPATQASILLNPYRNLYAAPASINKGAPIVLYPMNHPFSGSTTWQITSASSGAVRPPADTDQNMNALGDDWPVGTKVGLYNWSGGKPNEVWTSRIIAL